MFVFIFVLQLLFGADNVRYPCQHSADHPALGVEGGVPPPRAAPAVLRRMVLNERCAEWMSIKLCNNDEPGSFPCLCTLRYSDSSVLNFHRFGRLQAALTQNTVVL